VGHSLTLEFLVGFGGETAKINQKASQGSDGI
jgi:hypothetical protein